MASKEEKLLEVLRSLSPPRGPADPPKKADLPEGDPFVKRPASNGPLRASAPVEAGCLTGEAAQSPGSQGSAEDALLKTARSTRPAHSNGALLQPEMPSGVPQAGSLPRQLDKGCLNGALSNAVPAQRQVPLQRLPDVALEAGCLKNGRAVGLSLEEVGLFFLAAVLLVVLAFLMGWYGRGLAPPRPSGKTAHSNGALSTCRTVGGRPLDKMDASSVRDLGARSSGVERARSATTSRATYTLLAARFTAEPSGRAEAEEHRRFLEERGYAPAFVRLTTKGIELCAGEFDWALNPIMRDWREKIRRLRDTYAECHIAMITPRLEVGQDRR